MKKQEFLDKLKIKLSSLPQQEINERINFYSEMIDDRVEDGLTEEEAISDIGGLDEISKHIISEIPLKTIFKETITKKKNLNTGTKLLLILGSPIWLVLIVSFFGVALSLFISLWAILISLWAVFVSLILGGLIGVILGIVYLVQGSTGVLLGLSIVGIGLGIFSYFGCKELTKLLIKFSKNIVIWIKNLFIKKEVR